MFGPIKIIKKKSILYINNYFDGAVSFSSVIPMNRTGAVKSNNKIVVAIEKAT